jgi:Zn-dependent M28 family amino/carboxypeptidase
MPARFLLAAASLALLTTPSAAQVRWADAAARAVSEAVLKSHWQALAHDSMEGRRAGTPGEQRAARYIAAQFRRLGLQPTGDSGTYFQHFTISSRQGSTSTEALNVVGCLPGKRGMTELVLLGAHYDAYGIGPVVAGDSIYNGALDNASGTATMLSAAEALAMSSAKPQRAICFAAFGAEERGLLGSKAYIAALRNSTNVVGMLNIDGANIWGQARDVAVLGDDLSTLGADFHHAAAAEGLRVSVHAEEIRQGLFSASDHYAFAAAGIPALFFRRGKDLVDGGATAWEERRKDYYEGGRYHGRSDEILEWHSTAGAAQQARVAVRLLLDVADAPRRPAWNEDSELVKKLKASNRWRGPR